jgi:hypothetical protein
MQRLLLAAGQAARWLFCVRAFEKASIDPIKAQEKLLMRLVAKNKATIFGRQHLFEGISSIADFQANVPLMRYKDYIPYIEQLKEGKQDMLTKESVRLFGMTSGTTGSPKFCPITDSFEDDYRRNWDIWTYYAYRDHPRMFDGKAFIMVSPETEGYTSGGIPFGSISGMIANHLSPIVRSVYALPYHIFTIKDYDARYYAILRLVAEKEISAIVTPNPSLLILMAKRFMANKDRIIDDIEKGTLSRDLKIDEVNRRLIEARLRPDPHLARRLRKAERLGEIWPGLSLVGCWKEGTVSAFLKELKKHYGDCAVRDIGLISTEGHSTIPVEDEGGRGVLALTTHFFEFMRPGSRETLTCDKLIEGKEYFLIITTSAGLYRYHTNDLVKVVGFRNKAPLIEFLHKGEHITSITGEKLTEWQVVNAVRRAAHETEINHFTAFANSRRNGYDLLMEHKGSPSFAKAVDSHLKELNVEYKAKRESGRLKPLILKEVKPGSYARLHKKKSEKGAHDAQIKIPALTDDPDFERKLV